MSIHDTYQETPEVEPLLPEKKKEEPKGLWNYVSEFFDDSVSEIELKWCNIVFLLVISITVASNCIYLYEYYKLATTNDMLLVSYKPIQYPMLIVDATDDLKTIQYPLQRPPIVFHRSS